MSTTGNWNLDKSLRSKYYLEEAFLNLSCQVIGSTIKSVKIDNIKGEAHVVLDANNFAFAFESNFTFDMSFVTNINEGQEVKGKVSLSDKILRNIRTVDSSAFVFTWGKGAGGFSLHQSQGVFQSQRCRVALSALHSDYLDVCYTRFLNHDAPSMALPGDEGSLELSASIETVETPVVAIGDDVDFEI